jgi:DNA-binding winged helix-turn-helix (wHTH) protein
MDANIEQVDSETELGFTFGNLRLEPDGTLLRGDEPIHLTPKELAALRVLLANPGRIVTPAQLKQFLWPDVHVTADSVPRCLSSLRSRLGPGVRIHTIYKRGYRLESPVHRHVPSEKNTLPRLAILPFAAGLFEPQHLVPAIAGHAAVIRVVPQVAG